MAHKMKSMKIELTKQRATVVAVHTVIGTAGKCHNRQRFSIIYCDPGLFDMGASE